MDTGATRSCMNYNTTYKLGKEQIKQFNTMQVVGADGSDLGAAGTITCKICLGDIEDGANFHRMQTFKKECNLWEWTLHKI